MQFDLIVADPPWSFSDHLTMSNTKRGSDAQYNTLTIESLKKIPVHNITANNSVLCLWVVGSQLQAGLDVMQAWGFKQKQVWVWVKTKQAPINFIIDKLDVLIVKSIKFIKKETVLKVNLNDILDFKMGRLFRQTHEICLVGLKGDDVYKELLESKSQRSVGISPSLKHSAKTELLQDKLDIMFPNAIKLELFGRRSRVGWSVVGLEAPSTPNEDIVTSINRLSKI